MGVLVDSTFFCADVVLPIESLQKHGIPYLFSLSDHLASLETAASVQATTYVPGHGAPLNRSEFLQLVQANRAVLREIRDAVLAACHEPKSAESILADVLRSLNTNPRDAAAYYLLQATVAAYLTALHREGLVEHMVSEQHALWQARDTAST
jgi:glyoxylase-like metal-dependent hydrolase (beta-lactamase superfamily II)